MTTLSKKVKDLAEQIGTPKGDITFERLAPDVQAFFIAEKQKNVIDYRLPDGTEISMRDSGRLPINFGAMRDDVMLSNNIWLYGPAGTGKTTTAKKLCDALNRKYVVVNCNERTQPSQFMGKQNPFDGSYIEGDLINAWENGLVLILDELPKSDPNVIAVLNEALALADKTGEDSIIRNANGRAVMKHPSFACIATGNTAGIASNETYGANNVQDASLTDRFSYYECGFDRHLEYSLAFTKVFEIATALRTQIVERELPMVISLRKMLQWGKIYNLEMSRLSGATPDPNTEGEGTTLLKAVKQFLALIDEGDREEITDAINLKTFANTYRDMGVYENDKMQLENKIKTLAE